MDALSCVIQELFGSITALLYSPAHYFCAIVYSIGNRAGCTRSLVRRFGDVFSSSFHYGL
jgi:hypothetical protein